MNQLCVKCGGELREYLVCFECRKSLYRICKMCRNIDEKQLHFHNMLLLPMIPNWPFAMQKGMQAVA